MRHDVVYGDFVEHFSLIGGGRIMELDKLSLKATEKTL